MWALLCCAPDEWCEREVKPRLRGTAAEIRYADDFICCLRYREDAARVLRVLPQRFTKWAEASSRENAARGVLAVWRRRRSGSDFLGSAHVCARSRRGS